MTDEIARLKRLAGVTDARGKSFNPDPINHLQHMKGKNIKPGTDEWFKESFPLNDFQFPAGFRGRKKK